ncbi:unnamed protein product [Clonostachys rosea f. rosea IK726]|uniref:Rhodopsin domain-containing protein n=2 Tax=Bionectria ochroleuca TaxID=29856 RepID=A0A8H7N6T4_BIOOC|nr:unnamed protein product [Clonostachys rosea f. rosea IK726]
MAIGEIDAAAPVPSVITTALVVVSVLFPVLSLIAITLRVIASRRSRQALYWSDGWIFVSFCFTLALSVMVWVFASLSGIDYYNIDPLAGTSYSLEIVFLSSCLIQFPLAAVKISILLFYKRIFVRKWFHKILWITIGLISVWCFVFFFLVLTQVDPISQSWKGGRLRYDSAALGLAQVGTSISLDFLVLCLPLPVISTLQMAKKRKIAVGMIFWLGGFCCIAAIIRLVFLHQSIHGVLGAENNIFLQSKQFIFMIIEPNCSIIAACLPCYGPLVSGGHSLGSIFNSIRSMFSLRSGSGSKQLTTTSQEHIAIGDTSKVQYDVEMQPHWSGYGPPTVHCIGGKLSSEANPASLHGENCINVTNGVTIHRDH